MKRVSIRRKERELSDMAKITFGAVQRAIRKAFEGSGISELPTPTPTPSSDPSTTTWEVLMIPKKRRGTTRHASSQNSGADPQQEELE